MIYDYKKCQVLQAVHAGVYLSLPLLAQLNYKHKNNADKLVKHLEMYTRYIETDN